MGQVTVGGAMGINNRGTMPPAAVLTGTPVPPGCATMMPHVTLGSTPPTTECLDQAAKMKEIEAIVGTPSAFNHPAPEAKFAPTKHCRY